MFRNTAVAALVILLASGCGQTPADPEAPLVVETPADPEAPLVVAGESFSEEDLGRILGRYQGDSASVEIALKNLINSRLVLADAVSRGIDTLPEVRRYAYEREREQLQNVWLTAILEEKVILPPDTVARFHEQLGTMVVFTVMNVEDSTLCDSLRRLTLAGANLGDLVEQHTSISYDAAIRGRVGPSDMMRVQAQDRSLLLGLEQDDVSGMGLFPSGWRFLYVDSLYYQEPEPLEEIAPFIEQLISSHLREDYKKVLEDSLRAANNLTVTDGIPELIAEHAIDDTGAYSVYTDEELAMDAYTFEGGSRTLFSLVENIASLPDMMPRTPTDPDWVDGYCRILGLYDIMAMEGRSRGYDTLPEVVFSVETQVNSRILDLYFEQVIEPRLIPTEEEIEEAYASNSDQLRIPEERSFDCIGAIGDEQLDLLSGIISRGEEPFDAVDDLTLLSDLTAPGEITVSRMLQRAQIPVPWDSLLFSSEIGDLLLCTLTVDRVLVFRPVEILPERDAELEEARADLIELLAEESEEEVVSALVDSLHSVYHYQVDRDFINGLIVHEEETESETVEETITAPAESQTTI